MQVYGNEGNVTEEINAVMSKWKSEFHKLFQGYEKNEFNKDLYDFAINEKKRLEEIGLNVNTYTFNAKISLEEMHKVLDKAKHNKAVGVDSLPNEVLKNNASCDLLKCLLNTIFGIHVIPSASKWLLLNPSPKIQLLIQDYHCNIGV